MMIIIVTFRPGKRKTAVAPNVRNGKGGNRRGYYYYRHNRRNALVLHSRSSGPTLSARRPFVVSASRRSAEDNEWLRKRRR